MTATTCLSWWACDHDSAVMHLNVYGAGIDPAGTGWQVARAQECEAQTGAAQTTEAAAEEVGGLWLPVLDALVTPCDDLHNVVPSNTPRLWTYIATLGLISCVLSWAAFASYRMATTA